MTVCVLLVTETDIAGFPGSTFVYGVFRDQAEAEAEGERLLAEAPSLYRSFEVIVESVI